MTNTTKNTKKKTSKKMIPQSNVFAFGGDWAKMDASQKGGVVSGVLGGVTSLAGSAISNLAVPEIANQQITANSNESLMSQMSSYKPIEIEKTNAGGSALSGAASGASAGMAFGPWGAAIGGLAGGLSGGISALIGNKKKERKEQQLQQQQRQGFTSKANEIGSNNFSNAFAQSLAQGGELNTFENGGTHEENPNGGIPQGVDENGTPNLVEQGESKYKNYIFSDRLKYNKKNTFSDMAKNFSKESKERPNDPISKKGLEANLGKLRQSQDLFKAIQGKSESNTFEEGGSISDYLRNNKQDYSFGNRSKLAAQYGIKGYKGTADQNIQLLNYLKQSNTKPSIVFTPNTNYSEQEITAHLADLKKDAIVKPNVTQAKVTPTTTSAPSQKADYSTLLRYAPALASGAASITDALGITNKPDYQAAKEMDALSVKGERLNNYLAYKPLDQNYFINQLGANAAATRAGLRGIAGGNRATYMAGLLGADANYTEGLGKLARQATESNLAQRQQVEGFNRGTNQFNAQQSNWEQGINMQNKATAIGLREQARQNSTNAKMTNLNNFVDSLGSIGSENLYRNMIKNDPSSAYYIDALGNYIFKGAQKKNGGKLKTKGTIYGW